jgi:hypothetical protein
VRRRARLHIRADTSTPTASSPIALATARTVPHPQKGSTMVRVVVSSMTNRHASRQASNPHRLHTRLKPAIRQHVGREPAQRRAQHARKPEEVRVAGPPVRQRAGRFAAHDLVEQGDHSRPLGRARDHRPLVEPQPRAAHVALEEDRHALVRHGLRDQRRRLVEPAPPAVEPQAGQLGDVRQRRHDARARQPARAAQPAQRIGVMNGSSRAGGGERDHTARVRRPTVRVAGSASRSRSRFAPCRWRPAGRSWVPSRGSRARGG